MKVPVRDLLSRYPVGIGDMQYITAKTLQGKYVSRLFDNVPQSRLGIEIMIDLNNTLLEINQLRVEVSSEYKRTIRKYRKRAAPKFSDYAVPVPAADNE